MADGIRVLLIPSPSCAGSIGSVTKAIGLARKLTKNGCQVGFVMGGQLAGLIEQNGYRLFRAPVPKPAKLVQAINNVEDVIVWTGMADPQYVGDALKTESDAVIRFQPDVIFAETCPTASITASACQIPAVMIGSWPGHPDFPANLKSAGKTVETFNCHLKRQGLPLIDNIAELLYLRADVKVAPTIPELEPEMQAVPGIRFVGYSLDTEYETSKLTLECQNWIKGPLIFIYLSVSALSPGLYFDIITESFQNSPYQVLCACGFHYGLAELPAPTEKIRFEKYLPTQAIIKDTALVIFHGGQDTMLTALLHGLPSICIPGRHFERRYNSEQLARLGAGKLLSLHAFRPNRLPMVVEEVLSGPCGSVSKRLAEKLQREYGGTDRCAELIIAAGNQKPVSNLL
jgi:UDP:flavonoid glycosyltransferase YjiC (YdhE family)